MTFHRKYRPEQVPEPPFFRGEQPNDVCDFLLPSGDACDQPTAYDVWWTPVPEMDCDTIPVTSVCPQHVVVVDRRLVDRMCTTESRANA